MVFNTLISPRAKARLKALAEVEGVYAYRVLEESFWERWERLPAATRGKAEALAQGIEATMWREAAKKGGGDEGESA